VLVRRLHDTGKSGWTILLAIISLVGIILLVFLCRDSDRGENQYGPNPKGRRKRRSREEEDPFDD